MSTEISTSHQSIRYLSYYLAFLIIKFLQKDIIKLTSMVDSFLWNDKHDILACIADGRLHTWYYPNAIYVDKDLMDLCKNIKVPPKNSTWGLANFNCSSKEA